MITFSDIRGDSLSKLLQVRAKMHGVFMKWTGQAVADIDLLCQEYFYRKVLNECLWNGMKELMDMPELKTLPEPVYAQILSIVLRAQANFEMKHTAMRQAQTRSAPVLVEWPGA